MLDIGITKLMIIGGIALVVIGPERLPRVARMAGTLIGRAQRYVADVKAEVNRSVELEELQKMKEQFESAAREAFETQFRKDAAESPGSRIVGDSPILIEPYVVVAIAEGGGGFEAAARGEE